MANFDPFSGFRRAFDRLLSPGEVDLWFEAIVEHAEEAWRSSSPRAALFVLALSRKSARWSVPVSAHGHVDLAAFSSAEEAEAWCLSFLGSTSVYGCVRLEPDPELEIVKVVAERFGSVVAEWRTLDDGTIGEAVARVPDEAGWMARAALPARAGRLSEAPM